MLPKGPLNVIHFPSKFLNMEMTPPPFLNNVKKTALFLQDGFPNFEPSSFWIEIPIPQYRDVPTYYRNGKAPDALIYLYLMP